METNPYDLTSAQKTLLATLTQATGPAGLLPFFTFSRAILEGPCMPKKRMRVMARSSHLSLQKRREQSKRMKRLRAYSVFEAKRLAALKRKHADPVFQAKRLVACRGAAVKRRRKHLGVASVQT